jgi:hypothetical protein
MTTMTSSAWLPATFGTDTGPNPGAETDVAISAINEVGLDHYLRKTRDPPAERLKGVRVSAAPI